MPVHYSVSHEIGANNIRFRVEADGASVLRSPTFGLSFDRDISGSSLSAIYNCFFAMFLHACKGSNDVVVHVPAGVSHGIPRALARFHRVKTVRVFVGSHEVDMTSGPWPAGHFADDALRGRTLAVLYGGGKDSTFALHQAARVHGGANIKAFTFQYFKDFESERERRTIERCLKPMTTALDTGFHVIRSDCHEAMDIPGFGLFYGAALIFAEAYNVGALCYSLEYTHFITKIWPDGKPRLTYEMCRPELNRLLSQAWSAALGRPFVIYNHNRHVSELHPFAYLKKQGTKLGTARDDVRSGNRRGPLLQLQEVL